VIEAINLEVFATAECVAQRAADIIAAEARIAVAARGRFVFAVSGGHTPWVMLRALAKADVPWPAMHIVQVDERVAPAGDPDRNLSHLRESLLDHSPLAGEQIHAMPVESDGLEVAAAKYAETLRQIAGSPPVLDLAHLGLGPDGHTASLVPGDPVLNVKDTDVSMTGIYQGRRRMTLTYPMINRSRRIFWVVTGSEKIEMLDRLLKGDESIPAGRIRRDQAIVLADETAAGQTMTKQGHSMRVGIATDHGGFGLKEELAAYLRGTGHEVVDFGAFSLNPGDDYPDFVIPLAHAVAAGKVERGLAVCGSGVGASVCANKIPGVRAGLVQDHYSAHQGVEHDDMNILCMGGRVVGPVVARELVDTFLAAGFTHEERHARRLRKVALLEGQAVHQ
jgi:6-phosphogluconolactonase